MNNFSMRLLILTMTSNCLLLAPTASTLADSLPIIPKPLQEIRHNGTFQFTVDTPIYYSAGLEAEAKMLKATIEQATQLALPLVPSSKEMPSTTEVEQSVRLALTDEHQVDPEGYRLVVTSDQISISSNDATGVFWGTQSLRQLIRPGDQAEVPACEIEDAPRFLWRGMHLDVGRHMFEIEDIKQLIDWMALHKLNRFHWHLTEDQGWRIEIKKYPKLTQVGAWRESTPPYGDRKGSDGKRYGGYYTQKEIRDLVEYADRRHITVVPEIDMPGHMSAAVASYPELGNDDIPSYEPSVVTRWGVFSYTLSPKDETFQWIDDVLSEVCELFPSEYIHIGGDEAPKKQWKQSAFAQSVIEREGLKNEHELQSWFIKRVEKILSGKGRKLIGWSEIREGGLSPQATVMAWRNWDSAVDSALEGHDVVMSPTSHTYFDRYQARPAEELAKGQDYEAIGGHLPLAKVYAFDPVPKKLKDTEFEQHILGCQAQLWTEYMKTWDKVQYRAFPRLSALAEVAWSSPTRRDYQDFQQRLKPMLARLKSANIRYFNPFE